MTVSTTPFLLPSIFFSLSLFRKRERKQVLTFISLLIPFAPRVYRLIKWTEQTFPTNKNEELLPILEKCTVELQEDTKYQKDLRYLRVWIKYADAVRTRPTYSNFSKRTISGRRTRCFTSVTRAFWKCAKRTSWRTRCIREELR